MNKYAGLLGEGEFGGKLVGWGSLERQHRASEAEKIENERTAAMNQETRARIESIMEYLRKTSVCVFLGVAIWVFVELALCVRQIRREVRGVAGLGERVERQVGVASKDVQFEVQEVARELKDTLRQAGGLAKTGRLVVAGAGRSMKRQEEYWERLSRESSQVAGDMRVLVGGVNGLVGDARQELEKTGKLRDEVAGEISGRVVKMLDLSNTSLAGLSKTGEELSASVLLSAKNVEGMTGNMVGVTGNLEKITASGVVIGKDAEVVSAGVAAWFKPQKTPFWRSVLVGVGRELVPVGVRAFLPQRVQVVGSSTIRVESSSLGDTKKD